MTQLLVGLTFGIVVGIFFFVLIFGMFLSRRLDEIEEKIGR